MTHLVSTCYTGAMTVQDERPRQPWRPPRLRVTKSGWLFIYFTVSILLLVAVNAAVIR